MPKRIGNYELGKTIGRGKYSKVKYCENWETGENHAMKIMSLKDIRRSRMETQLRREIAIMKMIDHKNVVKLREVLQTTRNIYIVMELITGGELFDKICSVDRFDEETGRGYFAQLVEGLAYCHAHGIAHRDLKPENLLLDKKGNLKITDFGLSTLANKNDKNQLLMTTCGTPNYVAPEVIRQRGYNGFKADVWSCGVILFVMLAGYLPFDDKNVQKLFRRIESGRYRCPRFFSRELKDLLSKMLNTNPQRRIEIKDVLRHKWITGGKKASGKKGPGPIRRFFERVFGKGRTKIPEPTKGDLEASICQTPDAVEMPRRRRDEGFDDDGVISTHGPREGSSSRPVVRQRPRGSDSEELDAESPPRAQPGDGNSFRGRAIGEGILRDDRSLDAFSLVSQFMMGNVSVLATGTRCPLIRRKTRFMGTCDGERMKTLLVQTFGRLNAFPKVKQFVKHCVVKGHFRTDGGRVVSIQALVISTIVDSICFVEFQRRRGDILDFQRFYRRCHTELREYIATERRKTRHPMQIQPVLEASGEVRIGGGSRPAGEGEVEEEEEEGEVATATATVAQRSDDG